MSLDSGIRDPRSGIRNKPIPDPGSRCQKAPNPGSRIRIRNTAYAGVDFIPQSGIYEFDYRKTYTRCREAVIMLCILRDRI